MSDLWRKTAVDIARMVRGKEVSAREVTMSALARLADVNPAINAVVQELPDEALAAADAVDQKIAGGGDAGAMAGVPVTIKVNTDQVGFASTNGLRIQKDLIAEHDSPVVSNFRNAGAIIIGRTNTPAFSLRWFARNSLHGHTLNPHNPAITPGGSSGGAAAATAAGIGAIGHGTDIGGSIRYPAYACGLHGLRPTLGRIPAVNFTAPDRHIGAQLMAVSGPIARTMADTRLGYEVLCGEDQRDPWWTPVPLELPAQPKRAALTIAPEGLKVDGTVTACLSKAARDLEEAGWTVEEVECPPFREPARLQATLWLAEFRRTGAAAVESEDDPDASFVYSQMVRLCNEPDLNDMLDALQRRATLLREWQLFFEQYPVLICPISGELPFPDLLDVASPEAFERVIEAQLTQVGLPLMGLPGLAVATGMTVQNVPVGVQLVGGRYREDTLLNAGDVIAAANPMAGPVDPRAL
ncbi:MAG: amidase family protein [Rhizobiales bacterium]|nr:amidase family protein [Hyphomicrobiales bacterium]